MLGRQRGDARSVALGASEQRGAFHLERGGDADQFSYATLRSPRSTPPVSAHFSIRDGIGLREDLEAFCRAQVFVRFALARRSVLKPCGSRGGAPVARSGRLRFLWHATWGVVIGYEVGDDTLAQKRDQCDRDLGAPMALLDPQRYQASDANHGCGPPLASWRRALGGRGRGRRG